MKENCQRQPETFNEKKRKLGGYRPLGSRNKSTIDLNRPIVNNDDLPVDLLLPRQNSTIDVVDYNEYEPHPLQSHAVLPIAREIESCIDDSNFSGGFGYKRHSETREDGYTRAVTNQLPAQRQAQSNQKLSLADLMSL